MSIWWIVAIAVAVVLISILWLRLHAFLALAMAGFLVAVLTPDAALVDYADLQMEKSKGAWTQQEAASFVSSSGAQRLAQSFGEYAGKIGILIALASVVGSCLMHSGAAAVIIRRMLAIVGEARASYALAGSSFLLGIPVFFDTVFYLMVPLAKSLRRQVGKDYVLYILAILAGGSLAHSLVPPTPGPLAVAAELHIEIFDMMVGGLAICCCSSVLSLSAAAVINRFVDVPLRDDETPADEKSAGGPPSIDEVEGPPFWLALLPIALPVLLIAGGTAWNMWIGSFDSGAAPAWTDSLGRIVKLASDKNVALGIAAAMAMGLLRWAPVASDRNQLIGKALASGGVIILITSAGGAFGTMLRYAGIAEAVAEMTGSLPGLMLLPLAFLVTASIRTLQGSATVAMITAAGVLQGFANPEILPYHPVYLATAIGAGSKPIMWMADSGFWVICKMSGMTESEGLRTLAPMSIAMGISALIFTVLGAWLLPMNH
ncbi:GntP family permease [Rosistilla oblonga]|uniref:Inner membrane permease YgbN n=1 Tax=Rosistilla oblonga TaxID=2527990 RepID=A0A518IS36_9BACT|nr:SLC13 family permease [Rosistilla oblonga]QDV55907.1 Inner membrane permease YgbN [Rosistilla oblonga]